MAYEWRGDIYVKALGPGARSFRLTEHEDYESSPAWSPDGRQIAFVRWFGSFVRWSEGGRTLYTVPALGGQERKLTDLGGLGWGTSFIPALSWSPDGDWLAFAERPSANDPSRIVRLSVATLERQPLTSPSEPSMGDRYPAFSPDGSSVAFVRSGPVGARDLDVWIQPMDGGEARRLTSQNYDECKAPTWTPDGGQILFTVGGEGIRRVSVEGGEPGPILGVGQNAAFPSLHGNRMVFQQITKQPLDIWRRPGRRSSNRDQAPERLVASSTGEMLPDYSPDGRRIALSSWRSGALNVWICDSDGANPVQLTTFENAPMPRWSPDSRRLAFMSGDAGDHNVYVVEADGGVPRRLTRQHSSDDLGTWSRAGRWVYFHSDRSGTDQIWKIPSEGGEAVQVTTGGGTYALESWDGRDVYYTKIGPTSGIWRVPVSGGEEEQVLPVPGLGWRGLSVSRSGLYYFRRLEARAEDISSTGGRGAGYAIDFLDLESGQVVNVFEDDGFYPWVDLAVSPDDKWILNVKSPLPVSELMLMENFR